MRRKPGNVIVTDDNIPKIALKAMETMRMLLLPRESPRAPHRYPPTIIPNRKPLLLQQHVIQHFNEIFVALPKKTMAESKPLSKDVKRRSHSADGRRNDTHLQQRTRINKGSLFSNFFTQCRLTEFQQHLQHQPSHRPTVVSNETFHILQGVINDDLSMVGIMTISRGLYLQLLLQFHSLLLKTSSFQHHLQEKQSKYVWLQHQDFKENYHKKLSCQKCLDLNPQNQS